MPRKGQGWGIWYTSGFVGVGPQRQRIVRGAGGEEKEEEKQEAGPGEASG